MKNFIIFLLTIMLFSSCKKIIVERTTPPVDIDSTEIIIEDIINF